MSSLEQKKTEQDQSSSGQNRSYLKWVIAIIVVIGLGSAFWWVPRFFPTFLTAIVAEKQPEVVTQLSPPLDCDTLKQETALLKSEVTALREQIRMAEQKPPVVQNINIPLLTAFMDLKMTIRFGMTYEKELLRLKKLTSENTSPLDEYAQFGIPALSYLINQFKRCMEDLAESSAKQSNLGFWQVLKAKLSTLVKITKLKQESSLSSDPWGLTSILALIKQGDVATALVQLNQKNLPENKSLQTWKIHAEAYVNVDRKLDEMMHKLFMNEQK
jgi:hypothetical protein